MNISVIIPTYNGAHKILHLLDALEKQTIGHFEIVIVVDGSTDNTVEILQKRNNHNYTIIVQKNKGRAGARNSGAVAAKGELLIFFDDDVLPSGDCIQKHCEHHLNNPQSILTGCLFENKKKARSDIYLYRVYLNEKWCKSLIPLQKNSLPMENIYMSAANCSISKKLFSELNGFDERLTDAEDYDMAIRAFHMGFHLYYKHHVFAEHTELITCGSYIMRQRQYVKALNRLSALKPELYSFFTQRKIIIPVGIKKLLWQCFTHKFWIWTVDNFNWLRIFPTFIRYKIYELIITANGTYFPEKVKM